jgi:hypothetical protein
MAVGDQAKAGTSSYVAFRQESTYGTDAVTTSALHTCEPISIGFKTEFETKKLPSLNKNRAATRQVQLGKNVSGTLETYLHPEESLHFLVNAMGGNYTFTSLTAAGDHSISTGNFSSTDTITSLSLHARKGDAHNFRYVGGVINSLKISAKVGEEARITAEFVFKDSTIGSADLAGSLSISTVAPFTYVDGTYRYAATEGSLTSSVAEAIQSFELEIKNNLVTDEKNRQLGSRLLSGLPPALNREVTLKISQRFDTSTTYNRMVENTGGAVALYFSGTSISSEYNRSMNIILPNVRFKNSDPVVSGSDEVLSSETEFDVLLSGNAGTSTSREIGITVRNGLTSKI